jgi:hypothetical protein
MKSDTLNKSFLNSFYIFYLFYLGSTCINRVSLLITYESYEVIELFMSRSSTRSILGFVFSIYLLLNSLRIRNFVSSLIYFDLVFMWLFYFPFLIWFFSFTNLNIFWAFRIHAILYGRRFIFKYSLGLS